MSYGGTIKTKKYTIMNKKEYERRLSVLNTYIDTQHRDIMKYIEMIGCLMKYSGKLSKKLQRVYKRVHEGVDVTNKDIIKILGKMEFGHV